MPAAPLIVRGGHVIAPQEVEQVLLAHPAVAEAAVVGVPDRLWGESVGAAVRLSAPLAEAAVGLTWHCRALIAGHKVPERWLFTAALPRAAGGAVCRATLSARLAAGFLPGSCGLSGTGAGQARLAMVDPVDLFRPRPAVEDLRIPRQVRRSPR